jgi:isopenicillin-N epimerase
VEFLLDPDVAYLNHGGFGACPTPVFERYQAYQRDLERQPTAFQAAIFDDAFTASRAAVAALVGADPDDTVLVPNATAGLNAAVRSLRLGEGDEILTTTHEYGAIVTTLGFGGGAVRAVAPEALVDAIGARTRVVLLSHITSPTAIVLDVAAACAAARSAGALSIVDGAHAPGHVDLDLTAIGADVYVGNCHKWLCAPKSVAFLHARREHQDRIEPVIVSWGWSPGASFAVRHGWAGTQDPAAYLSLPAAIEAHRELDWAGARRLAAVARERLVAAGYPAVDGPSAPCMFAVVLPDGADVAMHDALLGRHRVEVPVIAFGGRTLLRVSCAPYTTAADVDRLLAAIADVAPAR